MKFLKIILAFILTQQSYASVMGIGIGGGGAQGGISFDPLSPGHVYIGSDMGLVYESFDFGTTWSPISRKKIGFYVDLDHQSHMGFDNSGGLYWAAGGCDPQISLDRGKTWQPIKTLADMLPENCLAESTRIKYWFFSKDDLKMVGVGTTSGLLISRDLGKTWTRLFSNQDSLSSLMVDKSTLYHATNAGIFKFNPQTAQVAPLLTEALSAAAMGKDSKGLTLVGVEKTDNSRKRMFIKPAKEEVFSQQTQPVGTFVRMSPNNSSIIYFTGNSNIGEGAAIWMTEDSGSHWTQRYTDDSIAYREGKINPNPVGLYVGFWDSGYNDFQVAPNDPNLIAGSGNFFFKLSTNAGEQWKFPYAKLSPATDNVSKSNFWASTELNPVSAFFIKQNPSNNNMIVAGLADIGCVLSLDHGLTWRMCNIPDMNTTYDVVFNPGNPNQLFAAASSMHDFPNDWYADIHNDVPGGIFVSDDAGVNWRRVSPDESEYQNPYLALAIDFKKSPCHMYAGTKGKGIIASFDCGSNWQRLNNGFEPLETSVDSSEQKGSLIFPSIKISPVTGDVYAIHAGNRLWQHADNPFIKYTGIYKLNKNTNTWRQLGRPPKIQGPGPVLGNLYWKYPLDFAVDWSNPKQLYLVDMATAGTWKINGLWSSSDEGITWQQVLNFDGARKVLIKNHDVFVVGWADPDEPFMYHAAQGGQFEPVNVALPLQRVNDLLIDEQGFIFATFGGGLFRLNTVTD
ncbi:hypothetical protein [Fluoribacter gormanii]|uniref:Uncharacterized protein related to plant photosystem II stability/assembly factor n=1 Tax=Fluoribacter gormanii TaxID=464 RepID=A0A377GN55_9GAMM|nr:hypothetical protein [Fluoribacter gormanii]KTD04760.1 BNR/Asp-box repeat protein [Fluoribacter gormanii]SIR15801.1 hypothetical protein SAMN05421777_10774 [Fluoribacter gormanii]STO26240.1 Uncharacterized protein related to plant photosystem II stability/assembly factor [Fluoribacter gormanii]